MLDALFTVNTWDHLNNDDELVLGHDPVGYLGNLFFGFGGRMGRLEYIFASTFLLMSLATLYGATGLFFGLDWLNLTVAATLVPAAWSGLAIEVKRWHDQGRSGWWMLIRVLPLIGAPIASMMLLFWPGTAEKNDYDY